MNQERGKLDDAEKLYREMLDGRRRVLGEDNPITMVTTGNMGSILQQQGKLKEALPFYQSALDGQRACSGRTIPKPFKPKSTSPRSCTRREC